MRIRDAIESDAKALAEISDRPEAVMRELVHERSVRVAVSESKNASTPDSTPDSTATDDDGSTSGTEHAVEAFVSYDVQSGSVHVTEFGGSDGVVRQLFESPYRFAVREGMDLELLVSDDDTARKETVESLGFSPVGSGPRFDGRSTTRFRLEPDPDNEGTLI